MSDVNQALLVALEAMLGKAYKQNWNDQYADVLAQAEAAVELAKAPASEFPLLTATGTAGEGATNHTALISKLFQPTARYTSVSKGGTYERLGAMRGAGSLKGLSGIAYRDDKGSLFIREPECFAKRMVLIKPEGGV